MNNDRLKEMERELANAKIEQDKAYKENPLLQYSTTQLKAELRRRKGK